MLSLGVVILIWHRARTNEQDCGKFHELYGLRHAQASVSFRRRINHITDVRGGRGGGIYSSTAMPGKYEFCSKMFWWEADRRWYFGVDVGGGLTLEGGFAKRTPP